MGQRGEAHLLIQLRFLGYIQDLYRIERELKTATPEDRHRVRQEKAKSLLET